MPPPNLDSEEERPAEQNDAPQIKKHPVWNGLFMSLAIIVGIIGVSTLLKGAWSMGVILCLLSGIYFFSRHRAGQVQNPQDSKVWRTVGSVVGALFLISGLVIAGGFVLLLIALASWGSGGGSGK